MLGIVRKLSGVLFTGAVVAWTSVGAAAAAEFRDFEKSDFQAAQSEGRPILVGVHASWCPICKAQEPIVESLAESPEFAQMIIYTMDFDSQKQDVRSLGVQKQSTLIAFKGTEETARSVGDTDVDAIRALMESAVQ